MDSLIKSYLIHSYLYYVLDSPVITDKAYDKLCQVLLNKDIDHPFKLPDELIRRLRINPPEYSEPLWHTTSHHAR